MAETITRSLERAKSGIASIKVVTDGQLNNEGLYYRVSDLAGVSEVLTFSAYVRGNAVVRLKMQAGAYLYTGRGQRITDDTWTRLELSGMSDGTNDVRLYVETSGNSPSAVTFYVDCIQLERKPYATTYCDGDQPGCEWTGLFHGSASSRSAYTREGGRWVDLASEPDLYFTTIGGWGVAPIRNNIQPYGDSPGSYYQNSKVLDRIVTILFHAKKEELSSCPSRRSLDRLHSLRQTLFEIVKPDKTAANQQFMVEYQDGDFPMYCWARYDGGLEGEWDVRNQWVNSFPLRLLIVSPFLTVDNQEVASLAFSERKTINYAMRKYEGKWQAMNGGMNNQIYDFKIGKRGEVYACGEFTRSNFATDAVDPQIYTNFVAYWDGYQWQKLGSGANGIVNAIAVAPNGDVYATGSFTTIGGVAANRVAKWTGSAWSAMGTGLGTGSGFAIEVAPNGDVYVGGSFVQAGGADAYYCARYDGSWHPIGAEAGLNGIVYTIAISQDGESIYFGGAFTDENTNPLTVLKYVALFDVLSNVFSAVGNGFDNIVRKLVITSTGFVYACGDFTETAVTLDVMLYIAYWNGTAWFPIGVGADNVVRNIDVNSSGQILAAGDFTRIGAADTRYYGFWNGSAWIGLDAAIENASSAIKWDNNGDIYLSPDGTLATVASQTTVENIGTAETGPIVYIEGPGTLVWLENQTSKKTIYLDLDILDGEEIFIDFSRATIKSDVRGDLSYSVFPGSDFKSWTLLPGDNVISALMTGDIGSVMQISYVPRFWSADSTAKLETL